MVLAPLPHLHPPAACGCRVLQHHSSTSTVLASMAAHSWLGCATQQPPALHALSLGRCDNMERGAATSLALLLGPKLAAPDGRLLSYRRTALLLACDRPAWVATTSAAPLCSSRVLSSVREGVSWNCSEEGQGRQTVQVQSSSNVYVRLRQCEYEVQAGDATTHA